MSGLDTGSNAWILTSAALVLLMTPGLALFYGGLTRSKSVINMMMKCLAAIGIVSLLWVLYGASIAEGESDSAFWGGLSDLGMRSLLDFDANHDGGVSGGALAGFAMMFAIITVALISGAAADRMKFSAWMIFAAAWVSVVYFPVAFWVWGGGFIEQWGVLDFAGGTAVHVNAGAAALALALVIGRRIGWQRGKFAPHNLPLVLLGTGLLWFGWFGFNAGSAFASDDIAGLALLNTQIATACAVLAWIATDRLRGSKPTLLGACSGAIAGLVAITPAAGHVEPLGAIAVGAVAGIICPFAIGLKHRLGYDDSLDVVGLHMVAGAWGSVALGLLAVPALSDDTAGMIYGGSLGFFGMQALAVLVVAAYSFTVALLIALALKYTVGIRVTDTHELSGIDATEHGETSYDLSLSGTAPEQSEKKVAIASASS